MKPRLAALSPRLAVALLACLTAGACGDQGRSETRPRGARAQDVREAIPKRGTYRYATSGFERVEAESAGIAPVLTARLSYPRVSTVSVEAGGCGMSERWRAGTRRSTTSEYCLTAGRRRLRGLVDVHEFFDQPFRLHYSCTGPAVPVPQRIRVGTRWTDRCRALGAVAVAPQRVVGIERVRVSGRAVRAVHLRAEPHLSGIIRGRNRIDSWFARRDGLLLRRRVRSATRASSPIGQVRVRERYELRLRAEK